MGRLRHGCTRACRPLAPAVFVALAGCGGDRPAPAVTADSVSTTSATAPQPAAPATPAPAPPGGDTAQIPGGAPDSASLVDWTARDTRVTNRVTGVATLLAVRTAAHPEFDRIVFEFAGAEVPSYRLEYVDRPVRQCGSGDVVRLAGDAWLSIQFEPAQAHTEQGQPTVTERDRTPRLPNLLELKLICDFEAVVEWVAAVASPEPYRATVLKSPTRLVVDIRHPRRRPARVSSSPRSRAVRLPAA